MYLKKLLSLVAAISLALSLCACTETAKETNDYNDEIEVFEETVVEDDAYEYNDYEDNNDYRNNYTEPGNDYQPSYSSQDTTAPSNETTPSYEEVQSQTHTHTWREATCTERKTCTTCGETTGSRAAHDYTTATCTQRATCRVCGDTTGSKADHNYVPETCTTPETCTVCGDTRGRADGHEYFNDTCSKCGNKVTMPFTVECDSNMSYTLYGETAYFSVEQYNIIDIDQYSEGYAKIAVTIRNDTGGNAYYNIIYYNASGQVLDTSTCHVPESAGATQTTDRYIPINTTKIVIKAHVK